jgi:hypothetical protein
MSDYQIKSFQEFTTKDVPTQPVSYTFMDGLIPTSESEYVDYNDFKPETFGDHVTMELGAEGPAVIINTPYTEGGEIYINRFCAEFMNKQDELNRFLILLRNSY